MFPREEFPADEKLCFVLMPFDDKYKSVYGDVILPAAKEGLVGLEAKRADDIFEVKEPIIQDVWKYIDKARLIISDLSDKNPNVFYGVGLSHAIRKPVILIAKEIEDIPFDLRHLRGIIYQDNIRGANKLKNSLMQTIKQILNSS